jgi:hypothetical protein
MTIDIPESDRIKQRLINFRDLHPDRNDARTAAEFLIGVDGVLGAEPLTPLILSVRYDILRTCLQEIDEALVELGLHLDNGMMFKIKRALYYYTEETLRENCGCARGDSQCTKRVFAKRWESLEHGCRDQRPEHWRRYL